jgi:hypothetical protein
MIKFIRIGGQIEPEKDQFAFYGDCGDGCDSFVIVDCKMIFDNWASFYQSYKEDERLGAGGISWYETNPLSLFKSLMPQDMLPKEENSKCQNCGKQHNGVNLCCDDCYEEAFGEDKLIWRDCRIEKPKLKPSEEILDNLTQSLKLRVGDNIRSEDYIHFILNWLDKHFYEEKK